VESSTVIPSRIISALGLLVVVIAIKGGL